MNYSIGMGGSVFGPEVRATYASSHWQHLIRIKDDVLNPSEEAPSISVALRMRWAGKGWPDLETDLGEIKVRRRTREIEILVQIGLDDFNHGYEARFREFFAAHLTEAIERIAAHKDCAKIGLDPAQLRQTWQKVIEQYMAVELPLPPHMPPDQSEPPPPSNAEYFFEFDKKKDVTQFASALKSRGLKAEWDGESAEGYYVTVEDESSTKRNEVLEQELIALAEQCGGTYDGLAAK